MQHIDLSGPTLRNVEVAYEEYAYAVARKRYMPRPAAICTTGVCQVMLRRRTRRSFGDVGEQQLSEVLWHTSKVLEMHLATRSTRCQHRPTPSAGGRHPIDLLVARPEVPLGDTKVALYDPIAHALCDLILPDENQFDQLLCALDQALPLGKGTVLLFAAQFDRMLSKYVNGESLVWRDAGALVASISIVAEAFELSCCPVGFTGEPWLSRAFRSSLITGVGGCVIGTKTTA